MPARKSAQSAAPWSAGTASAERRSRRTDMFKHLLTALLALVSGLILSSNAGAQCPSWSPHGIFSGSALEEIYSNADGTVQFLVMVSVAARGVDAPPLAATTL